MSLVSFFLLCMNIHIAHKQAPVPQKTWECTDCVLRVMRAINLECWNRSIQSKNPLMWLPGRENTERNQKVHQTWITFRCSTYVWILNWIFIVWVVWSCILLSWGEHIRMNFKHTRNIKGAIKIRLPRSLSFEKSLINDFFHITTLDKNNLLLPRPI